MKILVQFPTKNRPLKFQEALVKLLSNAENRARLNVCAIIDSTEQKIFEYEKVYSRIKEELNFSFKIKRTPPLGKINACNFGVSEEYFDIIVLMSDDMICQVKGWDKIIEDKMKTNYPDNDGVLWFSDGYTKLNTLCVLGKKYYERFGYIYNNDYLSLFCDNEFQEVAEMLGKTNTQPYECLFKHEHPINNANIKQDELFFQNNSYYKTDKQTYTNRKKAKFFIEAYEKKLPKSENETKHIYKKNSMKTETKQHTRGVCLIACGSPYYSSWALNLCIAIKQKAPETKVTLLYHGEKSLNYIHHFTHIFNECVLIEGEFVKRNGIQSYMKPKVSLYDLSPYDETIFIDSDVLFDETKNIETLFEKCSNSGNFVIGNRGKVKVTGAQSLMWCTPADFVAKYGQETETINSSSEFIYFKKCDEVKNYFEVVKNIFSNPPIKNIDFAHDFPDEHAFNLACVELNYFPKLLPFLPFHWEKNTKKNITQSQMENDSECYGISFGGNSFNSFNKSLYDSYANKMAKQIGNRFPFFMYEKRKIMSNRNKV